VDWKDQLRNRAVTLLADPRVAALLQFKLRAKVEKSLEERVRVIAKRLNLASASELSELRRAVARLERQLEQARLEEDEIAADRALS
jgi:hypothetical protein